MLSQQQQTQKESFPKFLTLSMREKEQLGQNTRHRRNPASVHSMGAARCGPQARPGPHTFLSVWPSSSVKCQQHLTFVTLHHNHGVWAAYPGACSEVPPPLTAGVQQGGREGGSKWQPEKGAAHPPPPHSPWPDYGKLINMIWHDSEKTPN